MIIIGYPGVGKTNASKKFLDVIDLESSWMVVQQSGALVKPDMWEQIYCRLAEKLSEQGYIVCTSSHPEVVNILKELDDVVVCYPLEKGKKAYVYNLAERFIEDDSNKNYKALVRVINNFTEDIAELESLGLDKIVLEKGEYLADRLEKGGLNEDKDSE